MDLSSYDDKAFPMTKEACYSEIILCPGQMLFIPRWFWHFIVSISFEEAVSLSRKLGDSSIISAGGINDLTISISFWWGARIAKKYDDEVASTTGRVA